MNPSEGTSKGTRPPAWLNRWLITASVTLLGIAATVWVIGRLADLLLMVFLALFAAVVLIPATDWLEGRGWNRRWATLLVFAGALLMVILFLAALLPVFIDQTAAITGQLPGYLSSAEQWLNNLVDIDLVDSEVLSQLDDVGSLLQQYGAQVAGGVLAAGGTLFGVVFQGVTILLFAYYIVAETPKMLRLVLSLFSPRRQRVLLQIWQISIEKTGGYVYSRLILAVASAIATAVALAVLSVPYPVALGIWVGVISQFIPVVGTYLAGALPVLIALFEDPILAVWVLGWILVYQQIENLVFAPRVTARTMSIHPAVSVGAVIAGGTLLGAMGAVLALPVAAIIQSLISTYRHRHELVVGMESKDDPKE